MNPHEQATLEANAMLGVAAGETEAVFVFKYGRILSEFVDGEAARQRL